MTITFLAPDGVELSAQRWRQGSSASYGGGSGRRLGARSGFRVDTPSNILTATSTTWTLTPCVAMIDPLFATAQGAYPWATDANVTGDVTAADATYARKDIVYITINDSSAGDGSGALTAPVLYLAGTASASPVAPTLPARSFLVGTISVPVSGGGSPTVVLNPARFAAAGGVLPVADLTERNALTGYKGLYVHRADVNRLEWHDGTTWRGSGVLSYTETVFLQVTDYAATVEIGVASVAWADPGVPYRIRVSGSVEVTTSDPATVMEVRARLDTDTGTVIGGVWTRPAGIPAGAYASMGIGVGGLSAELTGARNVRALLYRPGAVGAWSSREFNNALTVDLILG